MGSWTASGFSFPQHQQQHDAAPTQAVHGHAGAASPSLSPTTDRHLTLSVPPTYNDSDSMGRAARPRPAPLQLHKQRSSNNEKYNPFLSPIPQSPLSPTTSVLASGLPLSMGPPGLGDTNGITAPSIPRRTLGRARLRLLLLGMTLLVVSLLSFSSDPSEALLLDVPSSSSDGIEQEASTMFESFASRAKALPKSLKHRLQRLPQYHLCREPDLFDNDWAPTVPVPENVEKHVQDVMQKTEVFAPSLTGQTPDGKHTPTVVTEAPPAVVSLAPELPVIPGFGNALSNPNNPTRAKFLVPIFACDEQETGAQMHIRQALHLAKAMNRTAILPNFGGTGSPTLSNCQSFAFDDIYNIEEANSAELWSAAYPTFKRYIAQATNGKKGKVSAQLAVVFSRYAFDQITHLPISDQDVLNQACVDTYPFKVSGPRLYVSTENQEPIHRVVESLAPAKDKDVIFVYFNHKSPFNEGGVADPLLQYRPQWGLWVKNPFPYWNYSTPVLEVFKEARSRLPEKFVAMQWRMERVPPKALEECSGMFLDAIVKGAREQGADTIYVASDAPLSPDEPFKSTSWDPAFQEGVRSSIGSLMDGLTKANLRVVTWKDVKPTELPGSILADNSPGIFDRLIVGKEASWLFAPNTNCGMKSAYLGSIQTMRQDRIGDIHETDWDKLGMTWIGEPIEGTFWWTKIPAWENWDKQNL